MCTINDNHMMYGSWDMEHNKHNFLSFWTNFCPFTPFSTQKIKILKKWKNTCRYYHFTHVYHKWQSHDLRFLKYGAWQIFLSFRTIYCTFTPLTTQKIKILKKWKNNLKMRYYHFTHKYYKQQSYDVWFLRYGAWQIQFFVILECFLPFTPLTAQKTKINKKWKKNTMRYHHFTQVYQKSWSYAILFLRYGAWQM